MNKKGSIEIVNNYQRIKDIREDRDLTQQQVAEILEIKQTQYSRYELGK
ncbi:MAG: helix-turn-helix transcriptional regulator [Clostridiales bacterium]|jgi:transcriptional regulator|nr:helix-turn-helix transcriptional regulator [Clostridiales bacterium]